mgnify:CR=1 FL=1
MNIVSTSLYHPPSRRKLRRWSPSLASMTRKSMCVKIIVWFLDVRMKDLPFITFVVVQTLRKTMSLESYYDIPCWMTSSTLAGLVEEAESWIRRRPIGWRSQKPDQWGADKPLGPIFLFIVIGIFLGVIVRCSTMSTQVVTSTWVSLCQKC